MTPTYSGSVIGKRLLPDKITDRNGNFITISNNIIQNGNGVPNDSHDWGIDYIVDTMGRTIDFYYESNLLRKVRQNRGGPDFDYALISYAPITISTNFSGLTPDPSNLNGQQVWQPWFIEYPTKHTTRLFYTSYGQMYLAEKWVPFVEGQGNGRPVAFTRYDMQSVGSYSAPSGALVGPGGNAAQTDCPKFSIRQEWAENWSPTSATTGWTALGSYYVAQYSYEFNVAGNFSKVIDPAGHVFRTDVTTDGLTHTSKTYASEAAYSGGGGTSLKTLTLTYEKDSGLSYTSNLRPSNVQITDGSYTRRTRYTYTTVNGVALPADVIEYNSDAATTYRHTATLYNTSTAYSDRHILGLPSEVKVFRGDGESNRVSWRVFTYDESAYFDPTGYTVTNHDAANYGTGLISGRANLTTVTEYETPGFGSRAVSHVKYDLLGNTRATYNAENHATEFFYDDNFTTAGNPATRALVTKVKDPDSYWSGAKYNYHTGLVAESYHIQGTSGTGGQQNTVSYGYDGVDRLNAVTRPDGGGYSRAYWDNWISMATYTKINQTASWDRYDFSAWDGAGHTRWQGGDHPNGVSSRYHLKLFNYDNVGRTIKATHDTEVDGNLAPVGDDATEGFKWTQIAYDALDRQDLITHPDGNTIDYSYTGCGCAGTYTVTVRDERYRYRKMSYDFLGRLSEARELTSSQATYSRARYNYDERDLLQKIEHFNSDNDSGAKQERTFNYDGYARLLNQTTPEAGTVSYEYWADDQVKKVTDARGLYAQFTYNSRNLLTDVDYSDSTLDVHYGYGEYGERTVMEEKSGGSVVASTSYAYDTYKRLQTETRSFQGLGGSYSVSYQYNYVDALKQISYNVGGWSKSVNYGYNYAGAPSTIGTDLVSISGLTTSNNVMKDLYYRAFGALKSVNYGNGRKLEAGYSHTRHTLTSLMVKKQDNSDTIINQSYDYYFTTGTNNGRVQKITDTADPNYTTTYEYDDFNRLDKAYGNAFYRDYDYDAWGNLTNVYASGNGETGSYGLSYAANGSGAPLNNRISNAGYSYDAAGNQTHDGSASATYDAASRLKTVGSNNSCDYDGDGRKVKQVSGGYPLYYLWSSVLGEPVVELDSAGGVYRAYVYGPGGQMLALLSQDGYFYWQHTDHLGSGRKMTDASGVVRYRAEYDPHGQVLLEVLNGAGSYSNSHKFTGYERDWATNLDYAKARTYTRYRGRFLQLDPLGLGAADVTNPQSLNRYGYVGNDPANFADPSGLLRMCFYSVKTLSGWDGDTWVVNRDVLVFEGCIDLGGGFGDGPIGGGGGGGGEPQGGEPAQPSFCRWPKR